VSLFYPEDEGRRFLWNIRYLRDYTVSYYLHGWKLSSNRWPTSTDSPWTSPTSWSAECYTVIEFRMQFWTCNTAVTQLNLRGVMMLCGSVTSAECFNFCQSQCLATCSPSTWQ
jgi:hypothetical protein